MCFSVYVTHTSPNSSLSLDFYLTDHLIPRTFLPRVHSNLVYYSSKVLIWYDTPRRRNARHSLHIIHIIAYYLILPGIMSLIPITDFTLVVFVPTVLILPRAHSITLKINCYFVAEKSGGWRCQTEFDYSLLFCFMKSYISRFSFAPLVLFFL
jgi:hypothetical protein